MAGHVVEQEEALSSALSEAFKNINCLIGLLEKIISIEESIAIFACLEDDLGFPEKHQMYEINAWDDEMRIRGDLLIPIAQSSPIWCQEIWHH